MATGLLAFVSYVFYYSLASVGGQANAKQIFRGVEDPPAAGGSSNPGFREFLKEANEGRSMEERRLAEEEAAREKGRELAELESTTQARLKAEGMGEDVVVAASANEDEEREMVRSAGFEEEGKGAGDAGKRRPIWKRVVFFWRRE